MPDPNPVKAINEWSCVLACVEWFFLREGKPLTQEELMCRFGPHHPKWINQRGVMSRGDIINLFEMLGIPVRKYGQFNEKAGMLEFINRYYDQGRNYVAAFVLTREPTNHCLAIHTFDGDKATLMQPDRNNPHYLTYSWDDLFGKHNSDVLWLMP